MNYLKEHLKKTVKVGGVSGSKELEQVSEAPQPKKSKKKTKKKAKKKSTKK